MLAAPDREGDDALAGVGGRRRGFRVEIDLPPVTSVLPGQLENISIRQVFAGRGERHFLPQLHDVAGERRPIPPREHTEEALGRLEAVFRPRVRRLIGQDENAPAGGDHALQGCEHTVEFPRGPWRGDDGDVERGGRRGLHPQFIRRAPGGGQAPDARHIVERRRRKVVHEQRAAVRHGAVGGENQIERFGHWVSSAPQSVASIRRTSGSIR